MSQILIRKETKADYFNTEHMVMRAFWNIHGPGCNEHYLVHILREDGAYLPEYSRVAELDGRIVGAIFYNLSDYIKEKKYAIIILLTMFFVVFLMSALLPKITIF